MTERPLPVTLFADFTSPFCFVTEVGLERVASERPLDLRARAFELHPTPAPLPDARGDAADLGELAPLAAEVGLELRPPGFRPRTRKAHEAARFAEERGVGDDMRRAIYGAYWQGGSDIGRIDVLMELAAELGLDPTELKIALDIDRYGDAVLTDLELARRLRVVHVPTLFLGTGAGARILEGARALSALDEAVAAG